MVGVLLAIVFAAVGTVFSNITLSDEFYRTVNTFLNLLTVLGGPYVIYLISKRTRKDLEPKVDKVIERTEHLAEWDGHERRED